MPGCEAIAKNLEIYLYGSVNNNFRVKAYAR